jgi:hypothetical protein
MGLMSRSKYVQLLRGDLQQLANHASHYGNCELESWSPRLVKCKCGLFQLLTRLERAGLISLTDRGAL